MTGLRLITALMALMLPLAVAAQTTSGFIRLTDRDDLLGWEAVGRLDIADGGFCTGSLIASDLVLTAAHCVFAKDDGAPVDPARMTFRAGLSGATAIAERKVSRVVTLPEYVHQARAQAENARFDIALLELDSPISTTDADPFAPHTGPIGQQSVSVVSYGAGRAEVLSRQKTCQVLGRQDGLIAFDCNVTFGSSGSPVFVKSGGRARILSVISMMGVLKDQKIALGMDLQEPLAALKARLHNTRPAPVPVLRRIPAQGSKHTTGARFVKP